MLDVSLRVEDGQIRPLYCDKTACPSAEGSGFDLGIGLGMQSQQNRTRGHDLAVAATRSMHLADDSSRSRVVGVEPGSDLGPTPSLWTSSTITRPKEQDFIA